MTRDTDTLIADLVGDLAPVRPLQPSRGMAFALGGLGAAVALAAAHGVRLDLLAGHMEPVVLLAAGLFVMLGLAASVTVIVMSRPRVGRDHGGWRWAAAMTALLPVAATVIALAGGGPGHGELAAWVASGVHCMMLGGALALTTFATLTLWLRRGAPTAPDRAGLLVGVAAGAFGIAAWSVHCPISDIVHIGLWHGATVVACVGLGRLAVPRLVRW